MKCWSRSGTTSVVVVIMGVEGLRTASGWFPADCWNAGQYHMSIDASLLYYEVPGSIGSKQGTTETGGSACP